MRTTLILAVVCLLTNCTTPPVKAPVFTDFFKSIPAKDTLVFAVTEGEGTEAPLATVDTIATDTFYRYVSDSLRAGIAHILEAGEPVMVSLGRVGLDASHEGLGVDTKAFWFRNQSLLIYDQQQKKVTDLFPVAEYYGGDGGQILRASWLITKKNKPTELIVRESAHSLKITENADEPQDLYAESVMRYSWQQDRFVQQATPDSTALIQYFKITWE